jgi:hypothetical protein
LRQAALRTKQPPSQPVVNITGAPASEANITGKWTDEITPRDTNF